MRIWLLENPEMLPNFLVQETVIREAGTGPELSVDSVSGGLLLLTLGITRILQQQSLDIAILGSPDNSNWSAKPLISFPQKFYCGTYGLSLDLNRHPDVRYLRAQWKMGRWRREETAPLFEFYLFAHDGPLRQYAGAA